MMSSAYTGKVPFSSEVRSDVKLKFDLSHATSIDHCKVLSLALYIVRRIMIEATSQTAMYSEIASIFSSVSSYIEV